MKHLLILMLAAASVTACSSGGGTPSNQLNQAPVSDPGSVQAPQDPAPIVPDPIPQPPSAACASMPILGTWAKLANSNGGIDTSDELTFNDDCTAHDVSCQVDFSYTTPTTQPDWIQYSATTGQFTVHDTSSRLNVPRCLGYSQYTLPKQCSYVKITDTHYYIACDFDGLREYVKQ